MVVTNSRTDRSETRTNQIIPRGHGNARTVHGTSTYAPIRGG